MFVDELEAAFAACPVAYFSQGLCEPHGPQNALGLDALKAHAICVRAAQAHGGIVAPCDYWHIHEIGTCAVWAARHVGEPPRTWLTAMPPWQHFRNVLYQIRQADAHGFKGAIFFTGHYGPNWQDLKRLIELVQPHAGVRLAGLPEFEANQPGFEPGRTGDHAGKVETSLLWALEPDCVDMSRMPPRDAKGPHFAMGGDAYQSDRRIGERMVRDEVAFLGKLSAKLCADYDQANAKPKLLTFADVERVWSEVVAPEFGKFMTMQKRWTEEEVPAEGSRWRRNMAIPDGL
jgi:creatinine amidohydrolase